MGKINGCLKAVFVFLNIFFLPAGIVLIFNILMINADVKVVRSLGTNWFWAIAIAMLGISLLGAFAACSESKTCLKVFAGFTVIGMIAMVTFGIAVVTLRSQEDEHFLKIILADIFGSLFIAVVVLTIAIHMIRKLSRRNTTTIAMAAVAVSTS